MESEESVEEGRRRGEAERGNMGDGRRLSKEREGVKESAREREDIRTKSFKESREKTSLAKLKEKGVTSSKSRALIAACFA